LSGVFDEVSGHAVAVDAWHAAVHPLAIRFSPVLIAALPQVVTVEPSTAFEAAMGLVGVAAVASPIYQLELAVSGTVPQGQPFCRSLALTCGAYDR
jgi:hypothetical protein